MVNGSARATLLLFTPTSVATVANPCSSDGKAYSQSFSRKVDAMP